jgi:ribosome-associated protein
MEEIIKLLDEKKAKDINVLNIKNVSFLSDYFVLCTGTSNVQIKAIADNVEKKLKEKGIFFINKEGYRSAQWILLDYGSVIVHIFDKELRTFYNLERLWLDAEEVNIDNLLN